MSLLPTGEASEDLTTYKFNLSDLDPSRVKVEEFTYKSPRNLPVKNTTFKFKVVLRAYNDLKAFKVNRDVEERDRDLKNSSSSRNGESSWVRIFSTNEDAASRAAKAFSHAIKLCGGKTSPF